MALADRWNPPSASVEPSSRWIRVKLGDQLIADSRRTMLLIQYGKPPDLPTYYFPRTDVVAGVLVEPRQTESGSTVWTVASGSRRVENAAWTHPTMGGPGQQLEDMVSFDWWSQLRWFEED